LGCLWTLSPHRPMASFHRHLTQRPAPIPAAVHRSPSAGLRANSQNGRRLGRCNGATLQTARLVDCSWPPPAAPRMHEAPAAATRSYRTERPGRVDGGGTSRDAAESKRARPTLPERSHRRRESKAVDAPGNARRAGVCIGRDDGRLSREHLQRRRVMPTCFIEPGVKNGTWPVARDT
jgi:hypothetical protein